MDLEQWVINVLDGIRVASTLDASYSLHLDKDDVEAIAKAYDSMKWIEIY